MRNSERALRDEVSGHIYAIDKCKDKLSQLRRSPKLIKSQDGASVMEKVNILCNLLDELVG